MFILAPHGQKIDEICRTTSCVALGQAGIEAQDWPHRIILVIIFPAIGVPRAFAVRVSHFRGHVVVERELVEELSTVEIEIRSPPAPQRLTMLPAETAESPDLMARSGTAIKDDAVFSRVILDPEEERLPLRIGLPR